MIGFAAGHANLVMGKSIDETIPSEISGSFGILVNAYICFGIMSSYFLGALLPSDEEDYASTEMWRVIFAFPIIVAIMQQLLFLIVYREEPIGYCITAGREEEAKKLMRRIYKKT